MDYNQQSVNIFNRKAQRYQDKYMDLSSCIDTFSAFIAGLSKSKSRVLELGCGPGNISHYLLKQNPEFSILATDLAPNMLALAKQNNPSVEVMLLDCRELNCLQERFDGIMCGFCLPYLTQQQAFNLIRDAARRLLENGVLYISCMEGCELAPKIDVSDNSDKMYTYFHRGETLVSALKGAGFNLVDIQRKRQASPIGEVTELFITARLDKVIT
ncbi:SAM-dependent methyltransferase [Shewanella sairae]|uniref:SAM-dependent methyltransferase n=1 Tax=Shewanella sairae TaxID=190310 RepID=A0ABQ4PA40_9GAMM|nr:class I SAM-dependent methyltransferase [Shewanella sairae]MCL1132287.1 class I SAM-dependent methyltransferase [Shewanella sairae]GIU44308.1 SAM-dependent methyltransferase [Shewanella sairae]